VRAIRNSEGTNVTDDSKDQGAEPRLEKAARETSHAGVPDYEITAQAIREKTAARKEGEELFFELALEDLTRAADLFRPIHDKTNGVDVGKMAFLGPLTWQDA